MTGPSSVATTIRTECVTFVTLRVKLRESGEPKVPSAALSVLPKSPAAPQTTLTRVQAM